MDVSYWVSFGKVGPAHIKTEIQELELSVESEEVMVEGGRSGNVLNSCLEILQGSYLG